MKYIDDITVEYIGEYKGTCECAVFMHKRTGCNDMLNNSINCLKCELTAKINSNIIEKDGNTWRYMS